MYVQEKSKILDNNYNSHCSKGLVIENKRYIIEVLLILSYLILFKIPFLVK